MNTTLKYFVLICFAGLLGYSGCEQVIQLDLQDSPVRTVIEGEVTSDPGPYRIYLRQTQPYYAEDSTPTLTGATILIRDDSGQVDLLTEVEPGVYETDSLVGIIGRTYTMEANIDGEIYTATEKMNRILPLAGAFPQIINQPPLDSGWYAIMLVEDPPGLGDYYRLKVFLNDTLLDGINNIYLADDDQGDGSVVPFLFPRTLESGDKIRGDLMSIGPNASAYYNQLVNLIRTGGSPFGAPPDNVPSNISNNALGFFGAYGVVRDSLVVP